MRCNPWRVLHDSDSATCWLIHFLRFRRAYPCGPSWQQHLHPSHVCKASIVGDPHYHDEYSMPTTPPTYSRCPFSEPTRFESWLYIHDSIYFLIALRPSLPYTRRATLHTHTATRGGWLQHLRIYRPPTPLQPSCLTFSSLIDRQYGGVVVDHERGWCLGVICYSLAHLHTQHYTITFFISVWSQRDVYFSPLFLYLAHHYATAIHPSLFHATGFSFHTHPSLETP